MKKIFTLALGLCLTVAMFAADRKPTVTVTAPKKYEIVIDGRSYSSNSRSGIDITNLYGGRHSVRVYEMSQAFFFRTKKLVSSSTFQLRNRDIAIDVSRFGQLQITEKGFDRGWDNRDFGKNDHNYGNDRDHSRRF